MLRKPILALTENRLQLAEVNEYCKDPEIWFDSKAFKDRNLFATTFDFFVDWENTKIADEVWIKRISDLDTIHNNSEKELRELIYECDGEEKVNKTYQFLRHQNMVQKYMIFRDVPEDDWYNDLEKVVEFDLSKEGENSIAQFTASQIQKKIYDLRHRPVKIGKAGLKYSTSTLEGYLSKQPFFWPGDADTVIYDDSDNPVAIIEFKKHTSASQIPFEDQKISNYLEQDILKYKSLALLRDTFNTNLFVLYFPIPSDINYIIIEKNRGASK